MVDYAAGKTVGGEPLVRWLEGLLRRPDDGHRVAVVLIDRIAQGGAWKEIGESELAADLDAATKAVDLAPDAAEFDAILAEEYARRANRPLDPATVARADRLKERLRGQLRPLFAQLAAAALAEDHDADDWTPEMLVQNVLHAQLRQWTRAGVPDAALDLIFAATVGGGVADDFAARDLAFERLSHTVQTALASLCDARPSGLGPILPDLLGEFFVLARLRGEMRLGDLGPDRVAASSRSLARRLEGEFPDESDEFWSRAVLDFEAWTPRQGENPVHGVASEALDALRGEAPRAAPWPRST